MRVVSREENGILRERGVTIKESKLTSGCVQYGHECWIDWVRNIQHGDASVASNVKIGAIVSESRVYDAG